LEIPSLQEFFYILHYEKKINKFSSYWLQFQESFKYTICIKIEDSITNQYKKIKLMIDNKDQEPEGAVENYLKLRYGIQNIDN
jgi:hypothetical protein